MSDGTPDDPTKRLMPWETGSEPPPPDATPTEVVQTPAPPTPEAVEPSPSEPSEPAQAPEPSASATAPEAAVPAAGLISAAPVGWDPQAPAPGAPVSAGQQAQVGWGTPGKVRREVPGAPGFDFGDTPSRFVAWLIDGVLSLILVLLVSILIGIVAGVGLATTSGAGRTPAAFWNGIGIVGALAGLLTRGAYFVFFWTGGRRSTPGQRLLKLQVGNAVDGRNLDLAQAGRRWVALDWPGFLVVLPIAAGAGTAIQLGWALVLLLTTVASATKQGFHDRFANTWVVKPADASNSGLIMGCLIILFLLVIIPIIAIIALIFLGSQMSTVLSTVGGSV